ncbi:MAG: hypothetical protein CR996_01280 [Draconibacterium sp.]|nr:MAG: hypothetical protein CR996_01280 [Draconibacterium sp.]PIF05543.1 MAG: hypothetical protein CSA36_05995 [Draconibacterium sp.]
MKCKNCNVEIIDSDNFCRTCGAKIVKERITLKNLFYNVVDALGWDNKFLLTLRYLLYQPHIVSSGFINGVRKKYANPFSFFVVTLTISLLVFNLFSDDFIELSSDVNIYQTEQHENSILSDKNSPKGYELLGFKSHKDLQKAINSKVLRYYNITSFLLLPLYTLLAFLVFRKPYNFGEHLVINTYLQGVLTFLSIVLFVLSLLTKINFITYGSFILMFIYYIFTYQKIYNLTLGRLSIKMLKFAALLIVLFLVVIILTAVVVMIYVN